MSWIQKPSLLSLSSSPLRGASGKLFFGGMDYRLPNIQITSGPNPALTEWQTSQLGGGMLLLSGTGEVRGIRPPEKELARANGKQAEPDLLELGDGSV